MEDNKSSKVVIDKSCSAGLIWIAGWLFTIGFLKLAFWKAVLAIIIWPYFLGNIFSWIK